MPTPSPSGLRLLIEGFYTQCLSLWRVFLHLFHRKSTVEYPEQMPYLPPRYRGRIVLTRDPDGEERCVACNLCVDVSLCTLARRPALGRHVA